jgi:uncharacterized protein YndB with AHSA1/START domain
VDQVERDVVVPATPEQVWEVVTSDGWLAELVSLDLRPGGDAAFVDKGSERTGWVEDVREHERLAFWWAADGEPAGRVELTLSPVDGCCTRVVVVESRPLEVLDLVGMPLAGGGSAYGPAMLALAGAR